MPIRYKLYSYPGFPQKLAAEYQPDMRPVRRGKYELMKDYAVIIITEDRNKKRLKIHAGFQSDGASVPRIAWSISGLTPDGMLRAGALMHDYLYRIRGHFLSAPTKRKDADKVFYDLMIAAGVARYRAWIAYRAVRLFGPRWR